MLGVIGINHHTATVDVREKYALSPEDAAELVSQWKAEGMLEGAVVLSTCNRIEIYFETSDKPFDAEMLMKRLADYHRVDFNPGIFISREGKEAVTHVFRLASGLESMVVGETQILGQLKEAFGQSTERKQSTSALSRMFHKAFETAKCIRTNHFLTASPISSGSASVALMDDKVPDRNISTLILGVGKMAETIYDSLFEKGYSDIKIFNRTTERAEKFALSHHNIPYFAGNRLVEALSQADLIFVATSSLKPIVTPHELAGRPASRPCYLFDMAVPRNISEDVTHLPNTQLYTIDDLRQAGEGGMLDLLDYDAIDHTIEEMVDDFFKWLDASAIREVIHIIQEASDHLLEKELDKLPSTMSDQEREVISHYDRHLRITFSTALAVATREITDNGKNLRYTEAIGKLFNAIISEPQ